MTYPLFLAQGKNVRARNAGGAASGGGGLPDPLNAGVPAGTTLTTVSGNVTLGPGDTLTNTHVTGSVGIYGANVTMTNCLVDGSININYRYDISNYTTTAPSNVLIQNCECELLDSRGFNGLTLDGVLSKPHAASGGTMTNFQAYDLFDGTNTILTSNLTIQNSYLKGIDPYLWDGTGAKPHCENLHLGGVHTVYLYNSRFELTASGVHAADTLTTFTANVTLDTTSGGGTGRYNQDVTIDRCQFIGANNFMLYFDADGTNAVTNCTFDNTPSGATVQYPISNYSGAQLPGGTYHSFTATGCTLNGVSLVGNYTQLSGQV